MTDTFFPLIRKAVPGDAEGVLAVYAPVVRETAVSFELEPPDLDEMRARMEGAARMAPWLVCVQGDALLGFAYAVRFRARPAYDWTLESSVYVHPAARRRGVARALYEALIEALRLQGYWRLIGGIALPNDASVRLHESLGFVAVGVVHEVGYKFDRWHDVGFWELALSACSAPRPPLAPSALENDPEWQRALAEASARVR